MKVLRKRLFCVLCVAILLIGAFPGSVLAAEPERIPDSAGPAAGELGGRAAGTIGRLAGKLREPLADKAKELLETGIVLSLEDLSEEGSDAAGNLLHLFCNATDYTINEILGVALETFDVVNEIDVEMDQLALRVERLLEEIERGFAQDAYDESAEKLDEVLTRLGPLWDTYTQLAEDYRKVSASPEEFQTLGIGADELMRRIYATYGPGHDSFADDLQKVHGALYSASGRTTFVDAQTELSRLDHPFEHQIVDEVSGAFSYGAGIEAALLWLYSEYANYMLGCSEAGTPPAWAHVPDMQCENFVYTGDDTIARINLQAEGSGISELMQPDEVETELFLVNGHAVDAYHVIVNADRKEYRISRETIDLGVAVGGHGLRGPQHEYAFQSADGRWYIPESETEMKTLFTPTIPNPGSWMSDAGGLALPGHDALLLSGIAEYRDDENTTFDQPLLDSHQLSPGVDTVWANSCDDVASGDTVKWASRSSEIPWNDTNMLCVYFRNADPGEDSPKDENGFLLPNDVTTLPAEINLYDGEGLNLTHLSTTDLGGRTIHIYGDAHVIGGGRAYKNGQIVLHGVASLLTADNLCLAAGSDREPLHAIATFEEDRISPARIRIRGACAFSGSNGFQCDADAEFSGDTSDASLELSGRTGINARDVNCDITFRALSVSLEGSENGLERGIYGLYDSDVRVSGGSYDLCPDPQVQHFPTLKIYLWSSSLDLVHETVRKADDRVYEIKISDGSTLVDWSYSYTLETRTGPGYSLGPLFMTMSGLDAYGNPATSETISLSGSGLFAVDEETIRVHSSIFFSDIQYVTLWATGDGYWWPQTIRIYNDTEMWVDGQRPYYELDTTAGSVTLEPTVLPATRYPQADRTLAAWAASLEVPDGGSLRGAHADGTPCDLTTRAATGQMIHVLNADGTVQRTVPVVVPGDVTGSGEMGLAQLVRLAQAYTGEKPLEGIYLEAGDWSKDGVISLCDLVRQASEYLGASQTKPRA